MTADLAVRIAAVVAALALIAVPYWRQIAAILAKAKAYQTDIVRVSVAGALIAVAFGAVPYGAITSQAAISIARIGVGLCAVACAVTLFAKRCVFPALVNATVLLLSGVFLLAGASLPQIPITLPVPIPAPVTTKATSCVYVYEKDAGPIHPSILAALDKINREKKIPATLFEQDTKDGTGEIPEQYKPALEAAKKVTLPAFVVLSGTTAISTVSAPKELVVQ